MPNITLNFPFDINVSAQEGDTAYYVPTTPSASFNVNSSAVIEIGVILSISPGIPSSMVVFTTLAPALYPNTGDFILFSKDNAVNMTSLLGYYGSAKFKNNSTAKAEMFATSCEINESSK